MITTELGELLEAPQWDDPSWDAELHRNIVQAIFEQAMFRPWLDSFATVHELLDEGIVDGEPRIERFLIPDAQGRRVHWLAPGNVDMIHSTVTGASVFEPPAQYLSYAGGLPLVQLRQANQGALQRMVNDLIDAGADTIDGRFRRKIGPLRYIAERARQDGGVAQVHVGIWGGHLSKHTTTDESWNLTGKSLIAACVIGDEEEVSPKPSADLAAEMAETQAFVDEHTRAPEDFVREELETRMIEEERDAIRAEVEDRSPAAMAAHDPVDEPVGDLVEVTETDDTRAAAQEASSVPGAVRARS